MRKIMGFWMLAITLVGFSALGLWNCNVSESGSDVTLLRLKLPDSLDVDKGLFDSVVISIYDGNGKATHPKIFHEPYNKSVDSARLDGFQLSPKASDPMVIKILAFRKDDSIWRFEIGVSNGKAEPKPAIYVGPQITPGEKKPSSIVIANPSPLNLKMGEEPVALSATVLPSGVSQALTWSLPATEVAEILPGNKIRGLKAGSVMVTAASTGTPTVFSTLQVTVGNAPAAVPEAVQIANESPVSLTVGGAMVTLAASIVPVNAPQGITWTLPANDIAEITAGNKIKGLKAGTVTATAASTDKPAVFSTIEIKVQEAPAILPLTLAISNSAPLNLAVGGAAATLEAKVTPDNASQNVIWTLEPAGIAEIVNGNQIRGLKAGAAKVIATSAVKSDVTDTLEVQVMVPVITPASISLQVASPLNLAVGGSPAELLAAVLPEGADQGILWSSLDTTVAQIVPGNKVKPLKAGKTTLTAKSKANPAVTATLEVQVIVPIKVDAISIAPKNLTLYTGGPDGKVNVTMTGTDTGAHFDLVSSSPTVATVSGTGAVKALKAGTTVLTASVVGYPAVLSLCSVLVITDPPVATVTADQTIPYGGEAVFDVSVTQAFGTVVEIKADMDGDGVFEQTVTAKSTAQFKRAYSEAKAFNVKIEVKDSEGNVVTVSRKVTVGAPGVPLVNIFDPANDTTINKLTYKVRFTVKDSAQKIDTSVDTMVTLKEGPNSIRAARKNAGGEGSDVVVITVDRTGPAKPVFTAWTAAQNPTTNSKPIWKWAALSDAAKYQVKMDNADTSTGMITVTGTQYQPGTALADGDHTLYLRALDALGNPSAVASQAVTVKASLPAKPLVDVAPASPSSVRTPTWKWKSGDPAKGNGIYKVWLNGVQKSNTVLPSYPPAAQVANLADGKYILEVKELDDLGQESATALAFPEILIDGTPPAISVTGHADASTTNLTNTLTVNLAGSITDAGGSGIASATYELSGATTAAAKPITPGAFTLPALTLANNGITTVTFKVADGAKNTDTYTVKFNVAIPKRTLTFASGTPRDGYITSDKNAIKVYYSVDQAAAEVEDVVIPEPADVASSTKFVYTKTVKNAAGEATTITRTFYRAKESVQFFVPGGTPGGDCKSWEKACRFYGTSGNANGGAWLQYGDYDITGTPLILNNSLKVYGGLKQNAINTSDLHATAETRILTVEGDGAYTASNRIMGGVELNRLTFSGYYQEAMMYFFAPASYKVNKCKFTKLYSTIVYVGLAINTGGADIEFTDCVFDNSEANGTFIYNMTQERVGTLTFVTSTFKSGGLEFDIEGGSGTNTMRFYPANTMTPRILVIESACGIATRPACPAR